MSNLDMVSVYAYLSSKCNNITILWHIQIHNMQPAVITLYKVGLTMTPYKLLATKFQHYRELLLDSAVPLDKNSRDLT